MVDEHDEHVRSRPVDPVGEDIDGCDAFASSLNETVLNISSYTFADAAAKLKRLRTVIALLRDSEHAIESWLADVWHDQQFDAPQEVTGVGTVEVRRGRDRRQWDHEGLSKAVLETLLADSGGEVPTPWQVRDMLMDAAGVGYWRITSLRRIGIDPDEYCVSSPGARTVVIQ